MADVFDEFEELFKTIGLSADAAKVAARGRHKTEAAARTAYATDEAEDLADSLRVRRSRGEALLANPRPAAERGDLSGQPQPVVEAATAARDVLGMSPADAREMAVRLHAREGRRGGAEHADWFLCTFAHALRRPADEVAAR